MLGAFAEWQSDEGLMDLSPGDTLFLYTDGLTEAPSENGDEFGDERLESVLALARSDKPEVMIDKVIGAVRKFSAGTQEDDITAVAIRRAPGPGR